MPPRQKSPRERAARALCKEHDLPEDMTFQGKPMWWSFLGEVDLVLKAALPLAEWQRVEAEGPSET